MFAVNVVENLPATAGLAPVTPVKVTPLIVTAEPEPKL
jgi:hypothetical protein